MCIILVLDICIKKMSKNLMCVTMISQIIILRCYNLDFVTDQLVNNFVTEHR